MTGEGWRKTTAEQPVPGDSFRGSRVAPPGSRGELMPSKRGSALSRLRSAARVAGGVLAMGGVAMVVGGMTFRTGVLGIPDPVWPVVVIGAGTMSVGACFLLMARERVGGAIVGVLLLLGGVLDVYFDAQGNLSLRAILRIPVLDVGGWLGVATIVVGIGILAAARLRRSPEPSEGK